MDDVQMGRGAHPGPSQTPTSANAPSASPSSKRTLQSNEYTIGLITALPGEMAAVMAVLDEEHNRPANFHRRPDDCNSYEWGRISEHNVVVVSFPIKNTGKSTAAHVATLMVAAFPSIRMGLMVGIGGGVPRPEDGADIRLGDVAVSTPSGNTGGVVQYDFGKDEEKDGEAFFRRTGSLNQPPQALLGAVGNLQQRQKRQRRSDVRSIIDEVMERNPQMAEDWEDEPPYTYQGFENDRLFLASYKHQEDRHDCSSCDFELAIPRKKRPQDMPRIHYGLIASGDRVIKSATTRDKVAGKLKQEIGADCFCFEMEAAGLMNNFPCLVVRGISDYADTHKNDVWQNYAAMTAAAYVKELLRVVDAPDVESTKSASEVIGKIHEGVEEIRDKTEHIIKTIEKDDVRTWLKPADPSTNLNDARKSHHDKTNTWFMNHSAYRNWRSSESTGRHLWLHGISGCGKTVLSSTIIDNLAGKCVYFFFDFRDAKKQTLDDVLRSLIYQLYSKLRMTHKTLLELYEYCGKGSRQPSTHELSGAFDGMVREEGQAQIILDALDESEEKSRAELYQWLQAHIQEKGGGRPMIQIITTNRSNQPDLRSGLGDLIPATCKLDIEEEADRTDVLRYIRTRFVRDGRFAIWRTRDRSENSNGGPVLDSMESSLIKKGGMMFRWVSLQLDVLAKCRNEVSVTKVLDDLPPDLNKTYSRSLLQIPKKHREDAIRLLQLLLYSTSPIDAEGVLEVLAIDLTAPLGSSIDSRRRMHDLEAVSSLMSSFITKSTDLWSKSLFQPLGSSELQGRTTLKLAHASVRDYLAAQSLESVLGVPFPEISATTFSETSSKALIVGICLTYLDLYSHTQHHKHTYSTDQAVSTVSSEWLGHVKAEGVEKAANDHIWEFVIRNMSACHFGLSQGFLSDYAGPPLFIASLHGLERIAHQLLRKGVKANERGGLEGLIQAIEVSEFYQDVLNGKRDVVVEVGACHATNTGQTALQVAFEKGHESIARLLLEYGAKLDTLDERYGKILQDSCRHSKENIVRLLIENEVDVNFQDQNHTTALHIACQRADDKIVQLLLEGGASVDMESYNHGSVLGHAIYRQLESITELLLEKGPVINDKILRRVCFDGNMNIVRLLLEKGAGINAWSSHFGTALEAACRNRNIDVVELLLEKRPEINAWGGDYETSLKTAYGNEHADMAKLLLDRGAMIDLPRERYGELLKIACDSWTSWWKDDGVIRMLLEKEADASGLSDFKLGVAYRAARFVCSKRVRVHLIDIAAQRDTIPSRDMLKADAKWQRDRKEKAVS